jgi:hypothetical protein
MVMLMHYQEGKAMRRLLLVAVLVTVLLVAFAGSALADGPYGYSAGYGYGGGYGMGYSQGYGNYGGYNMYPYYPTYNNCCCCYVYNPCPYTRYPKQVKYGYGGYSTYGGYPTYGGGGYAMYGGGGYGW